MADKQHLTIHDLPDAERPRERLLAGGATALSNAELLAAILGTGTHQESALHLAERLLASYTGLHGLAQASPTDLTQVRGLSSAKAAQLCAALELGKRLASQPASERSMITRAADAFPLIQDMRYLPQEHVRVILLDNQQRVQTIATVYVGTLNASIIRASEIFREAVVRNSPALILAHNHPSGDPSPSPEDIEITRLLVDAGQLLDIQVIDHIIVGERAWVSLKEMGLAFDRGSA